MTNTHGRDELLVLQPAGIKKLGPTPDRLLWMLQIAYSTSGNFAAASAPCQQTDSLISWGRGLEINPNTNTSSAVLKPILPSEPTILHISVYGLTAFWLEPLAIDHQYPSASRILHERAYSLPRRFRDCLTTSHDSLMEPPNKSQTGPCILGLPNKSTFRHKEDAFSGLMQPSNIMMDHQEPTAVRLCKVGWTSKVL